MNRTRLLAEVRRRKEYHGLAESLEDDEDLDLEYLEAAEDNDVPKLKKLVKQAAKKAGYNVGPVWHGTIADEFDEFDPTKVGRTGYPDTQVGPAFFFTTDRLTAATVSWSGEGSPSKPNFMEVFLKLQNPIKYDPNQWGEPDVIDTDRMARMIQMAREQGRDGVVYKSKAMGTTYVVLSPEQIKLANPVTFDRDGNPVMLSKRFNPASKKITESRSPDDEYMEAVEADDMETCQRMVDDAAKRAGYNTGPVWHGTNEVFDVFQERKTPKKNEMFSFGFHFTKSRDLSEQYGTRQVKGYLRIQNLLDVEQVVYRDSDVGQWVERVAPRTRWWPSEGREAGYLRNMLDVLPGRRAARVVQEAGYDGIFYRAVLGKMEVMGQRIIAEGDSFIVFSSEQIKSADPVTYDDDGNVIPLSKRFNPASKKITESSKSQVMQALLGAGPPDEWSGAVAGVLGEEMRKKIKSLWHSLSPAQKKEVRSKWEKKMLSKKESKFAEENKIRPSGTDMGAKEGDWQYIDSSCQTVQQLQLLYLTDLHRTPGNTIYGRTVDRYKKDPGEKYPVVYQDSETGEYLVDDGNHRIQAAKELGQKKVLVWVRKGLTGGRPHPALDSVRNLQLKESVAGDDLDAEIESQDYEPEPTSQQVESGNYKKAHVKVQGLDIAVENPKGTVRRGVSKDGVEWETELHHHYGYIKGTVGRDKDHVDVFLGPDPETTTVYIVNQVDPKTGDFDEHKCMVGFKSEDAAKKGYLANYEKGWKGLGSVVAKSVDDFKAWLKSGKTRKLAESRSPDAEYTAAVEAGDLEKCQRMVDEAAKKEGMLYEADYVAVKYDGREFRPGDCIQCSRVWADGEVTGEFLDGTSGLSFESDAKLGKQYRSLGHRYAIAGYNVGSGEDEGEVILQDAVVVGRLDPVLYNKDGSVVPLRDRFDRRSEFYKGKERLTESSVRETLQEVARQVQEAGVDVICTESALDVVDLAGEGKVVGYFHDDNPSAEVGVAEGGHDFALIGDRFIVDVWYIEMEDPSAQAVLDMQDAKEAEEIQRRYGDPENWKEVGGEEKICEVKWYNLDKPDLSKEILEMVRRVKSMYRSAGFKTSPIHRSPYSGSVYFKVPDIGRYGTEIRISDHEHPGHGTFRGWGIVLDNSSQGIQDILDAIQEEIDEEVEIRDS